MAVTLIAKNQVAGAHVVWNIPIPDNQIPAGIGSTVTLTDYATVNEIQDDPELIALINADNVIINDGSTDLTKAQSLAIVQTVAGPTPGGIPEDLAVTSVSASSFVSSSLFYGDGSNLTNLPAGSPAGSNTQIQFNDSTAFGGDAELTWNKTTDTLTVTGDISASVNVSGSDFYGGGANLTDLNASNVSAGTLANARLPATISVTNVSASTLVSASSFYGDGSNLTGIAAGSDTQVQFRDAGALAGDTDFTWNKTTNVLTLGGVSGSGNISGSDFYGGGSNLTALNASNISAGTLANARLPATISVTNVTASTEVSASFLYGDGSNLTNLPAGSAQGSDTQVQFNDGGSFNGDAQFTWNKTTNALTITGDVTASANVSGAFFYGDGSGLTGVSATASPAGSDTQIQFNQNGSLAASSLLTTDGTGSLTVLGNTVLGDAITDYHQVTGTLDIGDGTSYHLFDGVGTAKSLQNNTTIVEVVKATDFPSPLVTNTTYVVRGDILLTTPLTATAEAIAIMGADRNKDILRYHGTAPMITTTDINFTIRDLGFRTSGSVLTASNITTDDSTDNFGRVKVLSIESCEVRNSNDVWDITGYELVDVKDVLCWYVSGSEASMAFQSNRHLEINSCEIFNWHSETTPPTNYSSGSNIEFLTNDSGSAGEVGFAVVNMAGNIIHPVQNQDGLFIATGSTTRFGTIAGNTFIDVGQNADFDLFAGSTYDSASALNYDIAVNQGIADSISYAMAYFTGSVTQGANATYTLIDTTSGFVDENSQRMTVNTDGEITYNGTKPIYVTLAANITGLSQNNSGVYDFTIFRSGSTIGNNELSGAAGTVVNIQNGDGFQILCYYTTLIQPSEKFGVYARETGGGGGAEVNTIQFSIKE